MHGRVRRIGWIYGITAMLFLLLDLIWISGIAKDFYTEAIGGMLRDSVHWLPALLFYLLYNGGIVIFVLVPALDTGATIRQAASKGGLLGLVAYGTFDLSALALLEGWPVMITIVDMTWGALLTAGTASGTLWIERNVIKSEWLKANQLKRSSING